MTEQVPRELKSIVADSEATKILWSRSGNLNQTLLLSSEHGPIVLRRRRPSRRENVLSYTRGIMAAIGLDASAFHVFLRTAPQETEFMAKLASAGVSVPACLASGSDWMAYRYVPGRSLADLTAQSAPELSDAAEAAIARLRRRILRAHDAGLVCADRWGGNEIVADDGEVSLIDFDLAWEGDHEMLRHLDICVACVGILGSLAGPGVGLARRTVRRVLDQLMEKGFDRTRVTAILEGYRRYYGSGRQHATGLSRPAAFYSAFDPVLAAAISAVRGEHGE